MVAECLPEWQQKPRGGRRRAKAQGPEPLGQVDGAMAAQALASAASRQGHGDSKVTTAAAGAIPQTSTHKSEAPAAKWQHGWGELSAVEMANRIAQLQDMGFSASAARSALEVCDWDVNLALDCLVMREETSVLADPNQLSNTLKSSVLPDHLSVSKPRTSLASDSTSASGGSSPMMTPQQELTGPLLSPLVMPSVPLLPPSLAEMDAIFGLPASLSASAKAAPPTTNPFNGVVHVTGSQVLNAATGGAVNGALAVSVMPKRKLARVEHSWDCEPQNADTQMSIEEDSFVYVWSESKTAAGWIYAESLICGSRAGWLPASMLQQLPPNKCWMRCSKPCRAIYPTQLSVELGNLILVDISQPPVGDGWVYAEQLGSATGCQAVDFSGSAGWVPIQCIAWAEV